MTRVVDTRPLRDRLRSNMAMFIGIGVVLILVVAGLLIIPRLVPAPSSGPALVTAGQEKEYDVVAIMGQSNAQGGGLGYDPAVDVTVSGLYQLAGSGPNKGTIVPAADPLNQVTTWVSDGSPRVGPGMEFGRKLIEADPQRNVLLVPAAQGSTAMLDTTVDPANPQTYIWNPTPDGEVEMAMENLYTRAQTEIESALATPGSKLVAIIWAQGETDTGFIDRLPAGERAAATATYQARLLELIDDMNTRYPDVPFLIGGMVPEWVAEENDGVSYPGRAMIDQVDRSMADLRSNVSFVEGEPGAHNTESVAELLHYNAEGARKMGDNYYEAYLSASN